MSNKIKFKVSDKLVKARDGASYDIKNYTEGVDYVMRGCFKGEKAVFRADIFSCDKPQVSDKSDHVESCSSISQQVDEFEAMQGTRATLELDEKGLRIVFPSEPQPEEWRPPAPVQEAKPLQDDVHECKIKKVHTNFKWVETDRGRVWVGLKGANMRAGQVIKVKNGELFLGKTGPSGSMVRL